MSTFKSRLASNDINLNSYLDGLLRKNEAGENVSFLTLGKEIFKQVENQELKNNNGISFYNRSETPEVCRRILDTRELVKEDKAEMRKKWSFVDQNKYKVVD